MISYVEACRDANLFGPWFSGPTWATWDVIGKAIFGDPLHENELEIFKDLTGCEYAPERPVDEAWIIGGRRGGKDVRAASIVAYLATIGAEPRGWLQRLVRGERGVVQVLAVDRDQAKICLSYVKAFFEQPLLAQLVEDETADSIELTNGLAIEITTNDRRRVRGRTVVAAVFDELAFWRSDNSVNPDEEIYRAIKPAMATIPGALLIGISSPYARRGLLFKKHRAHYGKPGNILVVKAPTWVLNPSIARDGEFLTEAFADDPISAAAEFGAEFRSDVETFVSRDIVEACINTGVFERPYSARLSYEAFVDPSGGSADAMTLAIAHRDVDRVVLDCMRERKPPFSPEGVVAEFCAAIKSYGISSVTGDRYAGEWPREQFRKQGVFYELSGSVRSDLYQALLPLLNSGTVDLLDSQNEKLLTQLVGLERRVSRGGRESIDHALGAHDDLANAVAGVVSLCSEIAEPPELVFGTYGCAAESWR